MAIIEWTEKLSVGVPVIDQHHQRLIDLLNALHEGINTQTLDDVVGHVLPELVDYTAYHFSEEEKMLEKASYPGFEEHRRIHKSISGKVADMAGAYFDDPRNVFASELLMFMSGWLIEHIQSEDFAYRLWLVAP